MGEFSATATTAEKAVTKQRIPVEELTHEVLDEATVQTKYKAGYCLFTVTSKFDGDKSFGDVLFEVLQPSQ